MNKPLKPPTESVATPVVTPIEQTTLPDGRDETTDPQAAGAAPAAGSLVQLNEQAPAIDESSAPQEMVSWGLERFAKQRIVMTSSFGMEGCALIDMAAKAIRAGELERLTVAYIDTGFFFPETHQLRKKLEEKYPEVDIVKWETDVSIKQQAESYGPELWKNNPQLCCHIRKVEPMTQHIGDFDVWITGVRRSQTEQRATQPVISWDWRYGVLKFCPLVTWTRADVWKYVQENEVPFNPLHLQNYPSISCFHCTRPVPGSAPDSDARDGRWAGEEKTECGLHFSI